MKTVHNHAYDEYLAIFVISVKTKKNPHHI